MLAAAIDPPWDSTIDRLIDSPIPRPFALVEIGLEQPWHRLSSDSWSRVVHDHRDVAVGSLGDDAHDRRLHRAPAGRLHRIEHQVHRYLPQLDAVGIDCRQVRIQVRHQQHPLVHRR